MKIVYTLCFLICSSFIQAQSIHSKIPLQDIGSGYNELELQGLELNDSIFIAGISGRKEPTKAFWILPNGKVVKIDSPELKNKLVVSLSCVNDSTYIYYLEDFKNYVLLRAIVQSNQTGVLTSSNKKILFTGSFVAMPNYGSHHYLMSIIKEKNEIHLIEISRMERLQEKVLNTQLDLNSNLSRFCFASENETLTPRAAASPNKIYQQENFIYVGVDNPEGKPATTSILKINLATGETKFATIVDDSKKPFRTYISKSYIFKITKSRSMGALITIHNLNDFSVYQTFKINEASPMSQNRSIKKDFTETTNKESVWDAVSNSSNGFIIATLTDSANFIIQLGSHHVISRSGAGFIPVFSAIPVLAIVGAVARIAAISLSDKESIDQYLYLRWDGKNEPAFADNPSSNIQAIDNYDLGLYQQDRNFDYKGYIQGRSKIFGIYHESGNPYVDIILFKSPR